MRGLDKKVFGTLFFSIFAAVTGVGIVVPLLPVYAHDLGASGLYIALIFAAFSLSRTFFLPYFGRLSDRNGRKPYIIAGLLCYTIISIAFTLVSGVEALILVRFLQGIASAMIMPVTQAYVGDITPEGSEGLSMGMFNMSVFWGLSIGPLTGGIINERFNLQTAFVCMGVLAFVGFVLSAILLPPTRTEKVATSRRQPLAWQALLRDREIAGLFLFRFSYTACIGIIWGFLPVMAAVEFALSSGAIGILVTLGVFVSGALHTPMGYLADRWSRTGMVLAGGLITSVAICAFRWVDGFWDLFLANLLFGVGGGVATPALMALAVLKGNQTEAMGSVMALLTMAHSMGMLIGSMSAGIMMDLLQLREAFLLGAGMMLAGAAFFLFAYPERPS